MVPWLFDCLSNPKKNEKIYAFLNESFEIKTILMFVNVTITDECSSFIVNHKNIFSFDTIRTNTKFVSVHEHS